MSSHGQMRQSRRRVVVFLGLVMVGFLAFRGPLVRGGAEVYERTAFALAPSASRASSYGLQHLDARNPAMYDIDAAEYFYRKAVAIDPTYPYVNHQLARVEFLRGNFNLALYYINKEIALHGDSEPNTYYVRGLIEGYAGDYTASAKDYKYFLQVDPHNWAGLNDYAWVLLKAGRFEDAASASAYGLTLFPQNPWLLNSYATATFELKHYEEALTAAKRAEAAVQTLDEREWLHAYPGNDPQIAGQGIASFKKAVADNMHTIQLALASSTVQ